MNRTLLPSYFVILIALSIASQAAKAINYTFDVDSSSGIGSGFFSIDLPDAWPGNIGHSTIIEASSFHAFSTLEMVGFHFQSR